LTHFIQLKCTLPITAYTHMRLNVNYINICVSYSNPNFPDNISCDHIQTVF